MSELAGRLLVAGSFVPGRVAWDRERITTVELRSAAASDDPLIAPGLVDLHVHGHGGCDPLDDLAGMARSLASAGTTAFQPTLFPDDPARLGESAARLAAEAEGLAQGARVVGLHLEGPFVNPERAGALPRERLAEPSPEALRAILGPATGDGRGVRTITVAPELRGSPELIAELARAGVRVSLGHSLASDGQAAAGARAGALGVTHLYNAMTPFHHREPGLVGFALTDRALHVELIGDLVHSDRRAIELAMAARGPGHLCLVSDALPGAGTGCDAFEWHGRHHLVSEGAAWFDAGGGEQVLAGSALGQLEMVQRLVAAGICSAAEALEMSGAAPARALGLEDELGVLRAGARADLIVLDPADLSLREVVVRGKSLPPELRAKQPRRRT